MPNSNDVSSLNTIKGYVSSTGSFLESVAYSGPFRNTLAIAWKETKGYFSSPMAYVVAAFFVTWTAVWFVRGTIDATFPEATIRGFLYFFLTWWIMVLLSSVLTMRLFAEEAKLGTLELLLTAPVKDYEVVLGKFLATLVMMLASLSLTLYFVLLLVWFGDPDPGPLLSGYLGIILLWSSALAVGLFASSLTNNQIVSFVVATAIVGLFYVIDVAAGRLTGVAADVLTQTSLLGHIDDFGRGVIDISHVIYYVSFTAVFLFLTVISLEMRRWR